MVVGVKADSGTYKTVKAAQAFALNMLGKEQKDLAFTFFRPVDVSDGKLSGQSFRKGETGAPLLIDAPGAIECCVTAIVEQEIMTSLSARLSRRISTNRCPADRIPQSLR